MTYEIFAKLYIIYLFNIVHMQKNDDLRPLRTETKMTQKPYLCRTPHSVGCKHQQTYQVYEQYASHPLCVRRILPSCVACFCGATHIVALQCGETEANLRRTKGCVPRTKVICVGPSNLSDADQSKAQLTCLLKHCAFQILSHLKP